MKYDFELELDSVNTMSLILGRMTAGTKVLEFGPANGRLTNHLKNKMDCRVWAVELDAQAAEDVMPFAEDVVVGDIESYQWMDRYKELKFDYIIFADVLEHLYDPKKVLETCKSLLEPKGKILMSLPNIAHNSILLELMAGRFNYQGVGLLDDTHIRFFTKSTLEAMVEGAGLNIYYESGVYLQPKETEFRIDYTRDQRELRHLPYGEVYQFVFEAGNEPGEKEEVFSNVFETQMAFCIYIDVGNGFTEDHILRVPQSVKNGIWTFDLSGYEVIKGLRIDPMDLDTELVLEGISLSDVDLNYKHNGRLNEGKIYFFNDDPQFICVNNEEYRPGELKLKFKHLSYIRNPRKYEIEVLQKVSAEQVKIINDLNGRLIESGQLKVMLKKIIKKLLFM